jgi:TonB-dependent Receptor Plug Domain
LALANLTLQVGNVSDSIVIQAQGAVVQTESAEHSGVLTTDQVENLLIKGRNVTTLLQLLPGVVDTNAPDAPDRNFAIGLSVNGQRRNAVGTWIDGVPTQDSGVGWIATANISMDAVAEVKVLLNNYQAEYGRMRGAGVQMIGKSGTRDFHGSFSYFKRNESYNANDFFSNRLGLPIARYRYNMYSYTIGGPVYIPKHWNKDRNKLFFWSQELWPQQVSFP